MALADFDAYVAEFNKQLSMSLTMTGNVGGAQRMCVLSRSAANVPPDASTATALDNTFAQAMDDLPASASGFYLLGGQFGGTTSAGYTTVLCDFLSIAGGLSATVTTTQTTNLPTAALTRYTSGVGVFIGIQIQALGVGTTATTFTVSYTNQNGTSGRTSTAQQIGGSGFREVGRLIIVPLQDGDTGVRSVESVTLAGSTGTAGDFAVLLFKPLAIFNLDTTDISQYFDAVSTGKWAGKLNKIEPAACVAPVGIFTSATWENGSIYLAQA